MRLKALDIHGFKSFADKTKFEFHPGVTGIVGPNGCGKSNVVDAIRWVLGETSAKALRGGEMADVIFNGTDKRQPVGMAEVTLTLADCEKALGVDYNEVAITRRVFRDGKSEYQINRTNCRLRDIQEMLMDTGIGRTAYSIMEQGKIDQLLSSKPEDRRAVFEEAAGITKFKAQKKEALRKLDYTEANLLRHADIIDEIRRQIGSLQRQAAKARRYQTVLEQVRVLDTHFSYRQFQTLQAERGELEQSIRSLLNRSGELENQIAGGEGRIEGERAGLTELEARIGEVRAHSQEQHTRINSAKNRIEFNGERSQELTALIERNTADVDATRRKVQEQAGELENANETLKAIEDNIRRQREELRDHMARNEAQRTRRAAIEKELRELREETSRAESQIASVKAKLSSSLTQIETDSSRKAVLDEESQRLDGDRVEKAEEAAKLKEEIEARKQMIAEEQEKLNTAEREFRLAREKQELLQKEMETLHRTLAEKTSRLKVLRHLAAEGEGLQKGTQAVIKGLDDPGFFKNGVRGVLGTFLDADAEFIPAIEAALGTHLQAVLVADTAMVEAIVNVLHQREMGTAELLSAEMLPARSDSQMEVVPAGATAWALDKVKANDQVRAIIARLLDNVLIVPDMATALALRPQMGGVTFATLRGEVISADGIIRGGRASGDGGSVLKRQAEIRQLEIDTEKLEHEQAAKQGERDALNQHILAVRNSVDEIRERLQGAKVAESTLQAQISMVQREMAQLVNKLEGVKWEQGELFKRVEQQERQVEELRKTQTDTEEQLQSRHDRIIQLDSELEAARRQETESAEYVNEVRTALAVEQRAEQAIVQQREPMAQRMKELEELVARREAEVDSYQEKIASAAEESRRLGDVINAARIEVERLDKDLGEMTEKRREVANQIREVETALGDARREFQRANEQRGREEVKATQIDLRLENLTEAIRQRYQIELENFEPDSHVLLAAIAEQRKASQRLAKRRATIAAKEDGDEADESAQDASDEAGADIEAEADEMEIPGDEGPDWDFVGQAVAELRQRLDSMGSVNLDAIQEFEELEERYEFLQREQNDLTKAKEDLLQIIQKINRETKVMFADTFGVVRENFKEIFRQLFGPQAKANLILMDESDPLESGIEIIAKPPGKQLQSITLLSGGERSMTAVALLFAIYKVKPSPFCVLDELDAPLDESNIGRFLKMLEQFVALPEGEGTEENTGKSQFVIVTHNKRTMNRADVIYGVTMEEFGVSKRVGMKMSGADAIAEPDPEPKSDGPAALPVRKKKKPLVLANGEVEARREGDSEG